MDTHETNGYQSAITTHCHSHRARLLCAAMSISTAHTSLTPTTHEMRAGLVDQLGAEVLGVLDRDAAAMGAQPPYPGALAVGAAAPGFALPDARGGQVSLAGLLADG